METFTNLEEALQSLRKVSRDWSDIDETASILYKAHVFFRNEVIFTQELFNVYDDIVTSIALIEMEEHPGELFDGRVFTSVLTKFGFEDIF